MPDPTTLSVVIADDHQIVRDGLRDALERSTAAHDLRFHIVAEAADGLEALAAAKAHQPALMFLDIAMPLATGAEILGDIKRWSPHTRVLVFTGVLAPGLLASVMQSGADAIFAKTAPADVAVQKLPMILRGGHYIAPELAEAISQGEATPELTSRERQTLTMIVTGKSNKEMARVLNISPKTVEKHRTNLMRKLDVHSAAELLARAVRDGLITTS